MKHKLWKNRFIKKTFRLTLCLMSASFLKTKAIKRSVNLSDILLSIISTGKKKKSFKKKKKLRLDFIHYIIFSLGFSLLAVTILILTLVPSLKDNFFFSSLRLESIKLFHKKSPLQDTYVERNFFSLSDEPAVTQATNRNDHENNSNDDAWLNRLRSRDPHLEVVDYNNIDFYRSSLKKYLDKMSYVKIYALIEFKHLQMGKDKSTLYQKADWHPVKAHNGAPTTVSVYYGRYRNLEVINRFRSVKNIYIPRVYSAKGFYQLDVTPNADRDAITIDVHLPYSRAGKLLQERNVSISIDNYTTKQLQNHLLTIKMPLKKNKTFTMLSHVRYKINLEDLLNSHVLAVGDNITIENYLALMRQTKYFHHDFTSFSEKIMPSTYINQAIKNISPQNDISFVWQTLTRKLNQDIQYNFKKRELFFSGDITYQNIKDMYMTAQELSKKRVGACPERSSLEASLLRSLGIAARTATRLYHIYTEIYLPNKGWVSTSFSVRGIPLVESNDNKQSYFIYWTPNHPLRLKWNGYLQPLLINNFKSNIIDNNHDVVQKLVVRK